MLRINLGKSRYRYTKKFSGQPKDIKSLCPDSILYDDIVVTNMVTTNIVTTNINENKMDDDEKFPNVINKHIPYKFQNDKSITIQPSNDDKSERPDNNDIS